MIDPVRCVQNVMLHAIAVVQRPDGQATTQSRLTET